MLDKLLAGGSAIDKVEGIVETACRRAGFVTQARPVEAQYLEQLGVLGDRPHGLARLLGEPVLLGAGDRHDEHRRRRFILQAAVDVVVALQHQVHLALADHRQQVLAQQHVVAPFARREERLMGQHDAPAVRIRRQRLVQPGGLRLRRAQVERGGAIDHDHAHVLVVEPVRRAPGLRHAIARQRERHRPVRAQHAALLRRVLELLEVFVIARRRRHDQRGRQHLVGFEPLAPLVVVLAVAAADQVAGEQGQARLRCRPHRLTHHPRGQADVLVLGVAEVQQRQRRSRRGRRAGVMPGAPGAVALYAPGVQGVGLQAVDVRAMVAGFAVLGLQRRTGRLDPARLAHVGRVAGDDDLQLRRADARVGAPRHRETGGRILRRRGHDAVGEAARRIAHHSLRHARVRFGLAHSLCGRRRAGRQQHDGQQPPHSCIPCTLHSAAHSGSDSALAMSRQSNADTA